MTFIYDLDDTLLKSNKTDKGYEKIIPMSNEIRLCNRAFDQGHIIIIHTGRNWDKYKQTILHLTKCGVKYHQLIMGRPQGIFIDATQSARSIEEYL